MDIECLAGMFWNQNVYTCFPCPADTYNSVPGRNTWCEPCTETCYKFMDEVYGCNATHDLLCECVEGYKRKTSYSKHCVRIKWPLPQVYNATENTPLSTSLEQVYYNVTENTSVYSNYPPWEQDWIWVWVLVSIVAAIMITGVLIWFVYRKKLKAKHQQPDEAMMPDPEKGPLVEQQPGFLEEKLLMSWDDQSSTENDSRNSVSQWNSGASDHASVNESSPDVDCQHSVTSTPYDRAGSSEVLHPSSLCVELESRYYSSLNLREDDLPPIEEDAEATGYRA